MEEVFLKGWDNRKLFEPALPNEPHIHENEIFSMLKQDRLFCYMIIRFWGRCYIKKVLLQRYVANIYNVEDESNFRNLIKVGGIYSQFVYPYAATEAEITRAERETIRVEVSARWKNIALLNSSYNPNAMSVRFVKDNTKWDEFMEEHDGSNGLFIENLRDSYIFPTNLGTMERAWIYEHRKTDALLLINRLGKDYFTEAIQYLKNERETKLHN